MALSAETVWEIRTDGNDGNGGGFVAGASGQDYSQQAGSQKSGGDLAIHASDSTRVQPVAAGVHANDVGNIVYISAGTGFTVGWYQIVSQDGTTYWTLDRSAGTTGSTNGTYAMGGAFKSLGGLGGGPWSNVASSVNNMKCYIRNGTYLLTTATANTSGGPLDNNANSMLDRGCLIKGYDPAQGRNSFDGTRPYFDFNGYAPANGLIYAHGEYDYGQLIAFLEIDLDGQNTYGIRYSSYAHALNVYAHDGGNTTLLHIPCSYCKVKTSTTGDGFGAPAAYCLADGVRYGYRHASTFNSVAKNCTQGFNQGYSSIRTNCVAYNCSDDGFADVWGTNYINCVAYRTTPGGAYAYDSSATGKQSYLLNCAANANWTNGRTRGVNWYDLNPITLTADPFTDAANDDFSLNDDPGGGALLKNLGLSVWGSSVANSVGAVDSLAGGGGGGSINRGILTGGRM